LQPFGPESFAFACSKSIKIEICVTALLPVLLCGHDTSLTLKEEHGLSIFESRVMRIFGAKKRSNRRMEKNA
jgi:hypothetical protein